jgi:hypothetical protein
MFVREDREANSRPPVVPVKVKVPNGSLTSSQNNHGSTPNQSQEVNNNKGVSTHHLNSSQSNELSAPVPQETETQGDDVKSKQNVGEEEEEVEEEDEEDDSLIAELIN